MKRVGRRTGLYNVNTAYVEMKRKVIIVGATSGLGRGIAETYISRGWTVGVAGRRENLLQEVVATAGAAPAYYAVCDVTDPVTAVPALQALVEQMVRALPCPVIAEGRVHTPEQAKKMLELGAWAVVVGGAITRPLEIAQRFFEGIR